MFEQLVRKSIRTMPDYPAPAIVEAPCKLNQNESPYDLPELLKQQIADRIRTTPLNRYYDGTSATLRQKLAKKYGVQPENILVGSGIDELLYYLTLAFVEKNNKIVRPVPSFAMYPLCARLAGAQDVVVPLGKNFELTPEFVQQSQDATLTFICRPNNPTGNSFDKATIETIAKNARGLVCIDEAYAEFAEDDCRDLLRYQNVVIMRTFSKAYSSAAVRLGYAIADAVIIRCMNKIRLPWNVNILSQIIGEIVLANDDYFEQKRLAIIEERQRLENAMRTMRGVVVYPSDSNFILFKTLRNAAAVFNALIEKGILIRNLEKSGLPGYLRANAGTPEENDRFLAALQETAAIDCVLFDVDGVLVDVSRSYRLAIQKTAEKFLRREVRSSEVDAIQRIPGFNNDWDATYALVKGLRDRKKVVRESDEYAAIKAEFQRLYLGTFINNEKLLVNPATFAVLRRVGLKLGIVTSRPKAEALYALRGFVPEFFDPGAIVAQEDCPEEKPSPKPLLLAQERLGAKNSIYVGDTINDQRAAGAAGMGFLSVASELSADGYLQDVNQIVEVILNGTN